MNFGFIGISVRTGVGRGGGGGVFCGGGGGGGGGGEVGYSGLYTPSTFVWKSRHNFSVKITTETFS